MLRTILHPTPKWGPEAPTSGPGLRPLEVVTGLPGNSRARPGPIAMIGGKVPPADRSGGPNSGGTPGGRGHCCHCFPGSGRRWEYPFDVAAARGTTGSIRSWRYGEKWARYFPHRGEFGKEVSHFSRLRERRYQVNPYGVRLLRELPAEGPLAPVLLHRL